MFKRDEELFTESTMSFGDHLEELRICLWRAVFWLLGGFIVGLLFGGNVASYVQVPLNKSLKKYYLDQTARHVRREAKALEKEGYYVDGLLEITKKNLTFETFYVYPGQLENLIDRNLLVFPERISENQSELDQIDNLNQRKSLPQLSVKSAEKPDKAEYQPTEVQFHEQPHPLLLFRKIEDVSGTRSKALGAHEPFAIYIKAALMVGVVVGSPGIFYSIWSFIAAGLYSHEKKYIYIFMPFSIILFIGGVLVAFFFVFGYVLDFLFAFNSWMNIDPDIRISEWISFAFLLPVGFGISFQLPLVIFVLERVGILTVDMLVSKWKIAVLIIFVISMLLTPADPQSMMLMAVPLTILYFFGIALCYFIPRKKSEFE